VYRDIVERQIGPWDAVEESQKFAQKWDKQEFLKIFYAGELIGGIWVQSFDSHYQLREIQIHPNYQRQGIGTKLVSDLISRCKSEGKQLRLRVLKSSPARCLYERLGFEAVGENDHQICMAYAL
jgi:ribosomal protein S18 acetylase RimI-like enzyme